MVPAKIILFGEYSVLLNGDSLCMPLPQFNAKWIFPSKQNEQTKKSNQHLRSFYQYLQTLPENFKKDIRLKEFKSDLEIGIAIESNIPEGYGLGSSGAAVALVYQKYFKHHKQNLAELMSLFAILESHFHGNSSGLDPLISHLNQNIYILHNKEPEIIKTSENNLLGDIKMLLVDSGQKRRAKEHIQHFKNKLNTNAEYHKNFAQEYTPLVNNYTASIIKQNHSFSELKEISQWQLKLFQEMIPQTLIPIFEHGLESNLFYLKLCGAGGGGYFLAFTKDVYKTQEYFKNNNIISITI